MSPREAEALSQARMLLAQHPELAEDDDFRADVLEGQTDILPFVDGLIEHLQRVASEEEVVRIRIAALTERKAMFGRRKDAVRASLAAVVAVTGKLVRPLATVSVTTGRQVLVIDDDAVAALPEAFKTVTVAPDKRAIAEALKAGEVIPGARLVPAPDSLLVRTS